MARERRRKANAQASFRWKKVRRESSVKGEGKSQRDTTNRSLAHLDAVNGDLRRVSLHPRRHAGAEHPSNGVHLVGPLAPYVVGGGQPRELHAVQRNEPRPFLPRDAQSAHPALARRKGGGDPKDETGGAPRATESRPAADGPAGRRNEGDVAERNAARCFEGSARACCGDVEPRRSLTAEFTREKCFPSPVESKQSCALLSIQ